MLEKLYAEMKDDSSSNESQRREQSIRRSDENPKRPYEYFKEQISKR